MPWFKVDDSFPTHPKRAGVSLSAIGLWALAGCWSAQHLTDGYVPANILPLLGGRTREAEELTASGLWATKEDGYQFHDWHKYQPSRVVVMAEREEARQRMERVRAKRRGSPELRPNTP